MQAKALICDEKHNFNYSDVILPDPGPEDIVVQNIYSGVSIGTEFARIRGDQGPGTYPLCTGYQAVGTIEYAGKGVSRFKVGDKVYYRDNKIMELSDGTKVNTMSGTHSSTALIRIEGRHRVELKPEGVDDDAASMFVMPAVGLYGVDMANPRMGDVVAVHGSGLIGLGVMAACSQRGCVVIAIDLEENRLEVARKLGADYIINGRTGNIKEELEKIAPEGADVVFEATGIPGCIDPAIELCRTEGKFILQGNYGNEPISYNFIPPHGKRLTMFYPCDDGQEPCRRAVLKNMATGALPWHHTITHRIKAQDSPDFYSAIYKGEAKDLIGAVIRW